MKTFMVKKGIIGFRPKFGRKLEMLEVNKIYQRESLILPDFALLTIFFQTCKIFLCKV